ncbi:hypothetical protein IV203_000789 [Nitzschia inconspicua]|uniref:Uncharacterized protein n=1 Tax=Nitzschia inconspicua TaxID=303405 RepID=A0A9K3L7A8_9STRA|nr:hypothetical protein IV203_000789 [Nitzschia inconspicua]
MSANNTISRTQTLIAGPLCIFAENRGWGNSIFAILTFLRQAKNVKMMLLRTGDESPTSTVKNSRNRVAKQSPILTKNTGYVDLRTATSCFPNDDNIPHCVDYAFPCIYLEDKQTDPTGLSTLGSVYVNLFIHMHACPNDPSIYNMKTCPRRTGQKKDVHELTIARDAIKANQHDFPELFHLNATHIKYILQESGSLVTMEDLIKNDICAMQFRFGDYWFRDNDSDRTWKDKRLCKDFDKKGNETYQCFEQQVDILMMEACPDPSVPVYLATDWEYFAHYVCDHYQKQSGGSNVTADVASSMVVDESKKRIFVSRCPSNSDTFTSDVSLPISNNTIPDNMHIHDVDLTSDSGKRILNCMLADWLVLALCKTSPLRKRHFAKKREYNDKLNSSSTETPYAIVSYGSTFVETADLTWKVV